MKTGECKWCHMRFNLDKNGKIPYHLDPFIAKDCRAEPVRCFGVFDDPTNGTVKSE